MGKVHFGPSDKPRRPVVSSQEQPQTVATEPIIIEKIVEVPVEKIVEKHVIEYRTVEVEKPVEVIKQVEVKVPVIEIKEVERIVHVDRPYEVIKEVIVHDIKQVLEEKVKGYKFKKQRDRARAVSVLLFIVLTVIGVLNG